ncbi:MAG: ribosome-binding factor [Patescibacteria group bacterium]|nr:ribosome-binding factor [Patescibacteria group bacterium]
MAVELGKTERQRKIMEELKKIAQDFFQRNSSGVSLITVTATDVTRDLRHANIFITVLPENKEKAALDFAYRMRSDLRTDIKKRLPIRTIPFVEVKIDEGEKVRQNIELILVKDKLRTKPE